MHSGLLVFLWLVAVAALQFLDIVPLAAVLLGSAVTAAIVAPARGLRLVKRVRYILFAIILLFAGFTPGEAVFVDWPLLSPSYQGVALAFEHAARVLVVVLFVALLMERLPPRRLVSALYALLRPFELSGFPTDRVAVRTLLVLHFVEGEKQPGWQHWISDEANDLHDEITIERERFRSCDLTVMLMLLTGFLVFLFWSFR